MKILIVEPGKHPRRADIPHTLEEMQRIVGGYIQAVYWFDDPVAIVCDDEGKLKGYELNRAVAGKDIRLETSLQLRRHVLHLWSRRGGLHRFAGRPRGEVREAVLPAPDLCADGCRHHGDQRGREKGDHLTMERDVYEEYGYDSRDDYLNSLSEDYGVPADAVYALAEILGPDEDFDGLVSNLEDAMYGGLFDETDSADGDDEDEDGDSDEEIERAEDTEDDGG